MTIMKLQEGMQELEVVIKFNTSLTTKYTSCDNIELFINYDILKKNFYDMDLSDQ